MRVASLWLLAAGVPHAVASPDRPPDILIHGVSTTHRNQISHATAENRYPHVFAEVHRLSRALSNDRAPKILSFGSSTGKEALTLASICFHHSIVVGVDVDDPTLSAARETITQANVSVSDRVFFFNAEKMPLDSLGTYDIIFADSVLCRNPWHFHRNATEFYPFSLFEETVILLDKVLREGGIVVMINTNYRFQDTSVGHAYHEAPVHSCTNFVPLFTPAGQRLPLQDVCVFTKQNSTMSPAPKSMRLRRKRV